MRDGRAGGPARRRAVSARRAVHAEPTTPTRTHTRTSPSAPSPKIGPSNRIPVWRSALRASPTGVRAESPQDIATARAAPITPIASARTAAIARICPPVIPTDRNAWRSRRSRPPRRERNWAMTATRARPTSTAIARAAHASMRVARCTASVRTGRRNANDVWAPAPSRSTSDANDVRPSVPRRSRTYSNGLSTSSPRYRAAKAGVRWIGGAMLSPSGGNSAGEASTPTTRKSTVGPCASSSMTGCGTVSARRRCSNPPSSATATGTNWSASTKRIRSRLPTWRPRRSAARKLTVTSSTAPGRARRPSRMRHRSISEPSSPSGATIGNTSAGPSERPVSVRPANRRTTEARADWDTAGRCADLGRVDVAHEEEGAPPHDERVRGVL